MSDFPTIGAGRFDAYPKSIGKHGSPPTVRCVPSGGVIERHVGGVAHNPWHGGRPECREAFVPLPCGKPIPVVWPFPNPPSVKTSLTSEQVRKSLKFRGVAQEIAKLSKDRSTQVGAVALGADYEVLGLAYNGFPRGVNDDVESRHARPAKYRYTAHAEENLIAAAARNGVSLRGCTVLVTALFPCTTCSRLMIQAGVKTIIAPRVDNSRWAEEAAVAMEMLSEAVIDVHYYEV